MQCRLASFFAWVLIPASTYAFEVHFPGFLIAKEWHDNTQTSRPDPVVLKVTERVNSPYECHEISFVFDVDDASSVPKELQYPFTIASPSAATLEEKPYWRSEAYPTFFLSYLSPHVNKAAAHGTWIIGNNPGVDSGIAYWRPDVDTRVPIGPDPSSKGDDSDAGGGIAASTTAAWHTLVSGRWETVSSLRAVCSSLVSGNTSGERDGGRAVTDHYYNVLHVNSRISTLLVPVSKPSSAVSAAIGNKMVSSESSFFKYYNNHQHRWVLFEASISTATSFSRGMPVQLSNIARGEFPTASKLVADEDGSRGWRLFFRNDDAGSSTETIVELGPDGVLDGVGIRSIRGPKGDAQRRVEEDKVLHAQRGEFIWVWVRRRPTVNSVIGGEGSSGKHARLADSGAVDNYLLRCEGGHSSSESTVSVFQYFHNHRRQIMERSMLSMHTSRFVALQSGLGTNSSGQSVFIIDGVEVEVIGAVTIGRDAINWIDAFLTSHEGFLSHDVSSCFMYHAAVTIPESLVYAAEIVCVLVGAKPMTLIQYTTKTDMQWKFPLVPELVNAIISLDSLRSSEGALTSIALQEVSSGGASNPIATSKKGGSQIGYKIFTYGADETLIIYREEDAFRVDLLRPYHTAQALHIVPYPPTGPDAVVQQAHMEQIHNSYINGYILGYPTRFVESYCNDLQNSLTEGQKRSALNRAKEEIRALANAGVLTKATSFISLNRASRIDSNGWNYIVEAALQI